MHCRQAGGLNDFAHKDRIFVRRPSEGVRIRFRMDELAMPGTPAARFRLVAQIDASAGARGSWLSRPVGGLPHAQWAVFVALKFYPFRR
ncbi:MAG TPA: hypothetical protein VEM39_02080 [Myxococcaceae bacterium]|nr:hypothetical protein [Myxococcaceae bacterium]